MDACQLLLFATETVPRPQVPLEERFGQFMRTGENTECIDDIMSGRSESRRFADYLLDKRSVIAEVKAIRADPHESLTRLITNEFREAGVFVFGQTGLSRVLRDLPRGHEIARRFTQVQGRRVRTEIREAAKQISSTREVFGLPDATGLLFLLVEKSAHIDASSTAYAIRDALERSNSASSGIDYVIAIVESHSIRLPNGQPGFPILFVRDALADRPDLERRFLASMIDYWAVWQGKALHFIDHGGEWDALYTMDRAPPLGPL